MYVSICVFVCLCAIMRLYMLKERMDEYKNVDWRIKAASIIREKGQRRENRNHEMKILKKMHKKKTIRRITITKKK